MCSDKKLMADYTADMRSKTGMKTLFGKKNIKKDNTEGKVSTLTSLLTVSDITGASSYILAQTACICHSGLARLTSARDH